MAHWSEQIGLCLVVEGRILFEHAPPASRQLVCGSCGRSSYWLLCAVRGAAWATCRCGVRVTHPDLTLDVVARLSGTPEVAWSTIEAAEAGFTGEGI